MSLLLMKWLTLLTTLKRGSIGGAFGYFLPAEKGENPQTPTQPATINARYSELDIQCLMLDSLLLVAQITQLDAAGSFVVREKTFNSLLDVEGDSIPRWLYTQPAEHYPGPINPCSRNRLSETKISSRLFITRN